MLLSFLLVLPSVAAQAQTDTAAPPPPPPPPAPVVVIVPPPAVAAPSAVEVATKPPTSAEAMPATRPDVLPPIDVGAWIRAGSVFQKAGDPKSLGDWKMDTSYIELHAGGKIHEKVSVTLNLNANLLAGTAVIEDAIISFDLADPFHLWVGQLLVPVDRSNASGPFFMIPWNYPGVAVGALPMEGPSGRNTGAVLWGEFNGGQVKYLVGAFDNGDAAKTVPQQTSPLFSGRLNLAIIGKEPGFWGNASYFGDKDILAVGVGAQFMKHGSSFMGQDKDYSEVNADILGEFKLGMGGWVTGEAAYYHYAVASTNTGAPKDSLYVLAAFASGLVGVGHIQPMVRYQWANPQSTAGVTVPKVWNLDVGLSYLIKGPALRLIATYSHTKITDDATANSLQFGAQAIFF